MELSVSALGVIVFTKIYPVLLKIGILANFCFTKDHFSLNLPCYQFLRSFEFGLLVLLWVLILKSQKKYFERVSPLGVGRNFSKMGVDLKKDQKHIKPNPENTSKAGKFPCLKPHFLNHRARACGRAWLVILVVK